MTLNLKNETHAKSYQGHRNDREERQTADPSSTPWGGRGEGKEGQNEGSSNLMV